MNTTIYKFGFWSGLIAFGATTAFVIVQLLQIVRAFRFPFDEIFIYGTSLCIVIPFVLEMLAFHYTTPTEKKYWSHAALVFTILYAVFVTSRTNLSRCSMDDNLTSHYDKCGRIIQKKQY
ncbi:MAG TPA: hypothetical protein VFI29_15715 [Hanamia sp.]|nr:hypothetical protein [Hanamia sp.]